MLENLSEKQIEIKEYIKAVIDPEVGVNIVDLGLVYEININEENKTVQVLMTLSSRGCPVGDTIIQHVDTVIRSNCSGYDVNVELVWEPEWSPEMITDAGRAFLNGN